jgi:hypothetical protein
MCHFGNFDSRIFSNLNPLLHKSSSQCGLLIGGFLLNQLRKINAPLETNSPEDFAENFCNNQMSKNERKKV